MRERSGNDVLRRLRDGLHLMGLAQVLILARLLPAAWLGETLRGLLPLLSLGALVAAIAATAVLPAGRNGPLSRWGARALQVGLGALLVDRVGGMLWSFGGFGPGPWLGPETNGTVVALAVHALLPLWPFLMWLLCRDLRLRGAALGWAAVVLAFLPGAFLLPAWGPLVLSVAAGARTARVLGRAAERIEARAAGELPPSAQAGRRPARRAPLLPRVHPGLRGSSL